MILREHGPQLKGRCWYIDPADEEAERQREAKRINDKWMDRFEDLHAGGWRQFRRILVDKEYRYRPVEVTIPAWVAVLFGFSGGRY